jgi:histidinol-phosphatase (PHP family)
LAEQRLSDLHVHSEFSWDAPEGSMEGSCREAVRLGTPAIAFTEHADFVGDAGGFDVDAYAESVARCRSLFPDLRILAGVELGEPHRFPSEADAVLKMYPFELVLGSCHSIPVGDELVWIGTGETLDPRVADENVRAFFHETLILVERTPVFAALTHLDYPKRYWPHSQLPYSESTFEDEYRAVLGAAAGAGVALEINTNGGSLEHGTCPGPVVLEWWREAGGTAVSFGSDAHRAADVLAAFDEVGAVVESAGFRPARHQFGFWLR